jgi:hypothetical protein
MARFSQRLSYRLLNSVGCLSPDPAFCQRGTAREPYNRGQWGSALRATPQATAGGVTNGRACRQPVRPRAHSFGLAGLANRLVNVSYCRIRDKVWRGI